MDRHSQILADQWTQQKHWVNSQCFSALFAGADSGDHHLTLIATLIQTAKLNQVDPLAWLTDVLEHIVSRRTKQHELHTLLQWNWKSPEPVNTG